MRRVALQSIGIALAAGLVLAGCGDTDDDTGDAGDETTMTTGGDDSGDDGGGGGEAASELEFTAEDIAFARDEVTAAAGEIAVTLVNDGSIEHSWLVEDHEDDLRLHVQSNGDMDDGTIELEAGDYVYYCDVPGHREAGMEGSLSVE